MPLRDYQDRCIKAILDRRAAGVKRQLISNAGGTGKCHAPGTPILLYSGEVKKVEEVKIGDQLMGPDSTPRTVLDLTHGFAEMYEIIPTKGNSYTVTGAHLLALRKTPKRKGQQPAFFTTSVEQYLLQCKFFKHMAQTYRVGVDFKTRPVPVEPYYIGLWLGDGNSKDPNITNPDHEVAEYLQEFTERLGLLYKTRDFKEPHCLLHTITSGIGAHKNPLTVSMRNLNLLHNKHIPDCYKVNSRKVRLDILAGLLDTDGFYGSGVFEISTVFPELARDVLFLARSLGFAAYENVGPKASQLGTVGIYHRIIISGHLDEIPTKIKRKQAAPRLQKKNVLVSGFEVESRGVGEYYGFETDGDHLYLMGDFTVTHNSVVFGHLPQYAAKGKRSLLTVHTKELVNQAAAHLKRWNPGLSVGVEMADQISSEEDIVVASVQTIGRNLGKRLSKFNPSDFSWLIVDECHRSIGETYLNVFEHFGLFNPEQTSTTLVGFTATPARGDSVALGSVYEEIVFSYSMQDAIRDGWLVDVRGIRVKTQVDLSKVGQKDGDFKQDEMAYAVNTPARNDLIVNAWIKECAPRRTIGFTVSVQHAKDLADAFMRQGVAAQAIWGDDPDRNEKLRLHQNGSLSILLCSQLLVEGYDDPYVSCVIMARPTKSSTYFIQATVRGDRLDPRVDNLVKARAEGRLKPEHKTDMILLDVADTSSKHSLVTLPSLFGLGAGLDLKGTSVMAAVTALEEVALKNPSLDLSKLDDITRLKSYVEQANLFEVNFCSEIVEVSALQWHRSIGNSYRLLLPGREQIAITGDLLGNYSVKGVVLGNRVESKDMSSLADAIAFAEKEVTSRDKGLLTLLRRESTWHKAPITDGQLKLLKQFRVPESVYKTWNKGQAAKYITAKLGEKRR